MVDAVRWIFAEVIHGLGAGEPVKQGIKHDANETTANCAVELHNFRRHSGKRNGGIFGIGANDEVV